MNLLRRLLLTATALVLWAPSARGQTCSVGLSSYQAQPATSGAGGALSSLTVNGTTTGCSRVNLSITCKQQIRTTVAANSSTTWTHTFTASELNQAGCTCGARATIAAECGDKYAQGCAQDSRTVDQLQCKGGGTFPPVCPSIQSVTCTHPSCPAPAGGNWQITCNAAVSGNVPSTASYWWVFSDPNNSAGQSTSLPSAIHTYHCPQPGFNSGVNVSIQGSCSPTPQNSAAITFPDCGCPALTLSAPQISGCVANFSASVAGSCISGATYKWKFGDSDTETPTSTPSTSRTYTASGSYPVTVRLAGGADCAPAQTIAVISSCGGPPPQDHKPPPGGKGCGWKFWKCIKFKLCWVLALIALVIVAGRLVLLAMYDFGVSVLGTPFTLDQLLSALSLLFLIPFLVFCPCEVAWGILIGAVLAVIVILVLLYYSAGSVPYWLKSIIVAALLIIATFTALAAGHCT